MRLGFDYPLSALRAAQLAALCLGAIALAGLAGVWAGHASAPRHSAPPPTATRSVHAGTASLVVPDDWRTVPLRSAGIAGLQPAATVVLAPYTEGPERVIVTFAAVDDPSLLPSALRAALSDPPPLPEATWLARRRAWLYSDLPVGTGDRTMDVTVLPSRAGVLAVACVSPQALWLANAGCADSVDAITVRSGATLAPSPEVALRLRLPGVLAALDAARVRARAELWHAGSAAEQDRSARRLAGAYRAAAASLRPVADDTGAALPDRLASTADAYAALARAARTGSIPAFEGARGGVEAAEARLAGTLETVAARGRRRTGRAARGGS